MRAKLIYIFIFMIRIYFTDVNAQVENCSITILDSNHVRQVYTDASLLSFESDLLTFAVDHSIHKVHINDLAKLEYFGNSAKPTGLLTGAAIGFAIGAAAVIALTGFSFHGSSNEKVNPVNVIGGGIMVGGIGALIGGSIQGTHREIVRVYFSEMSLIASRKKLNDIFKFYGN